MSDLPAARRLGANIVASEFQYLRSEQAALLSRICPDLFRALNEFNDLYLAAKGGAPVFTTKETATFLGISPRAVRLAVKRERLHPSGTDDGAYLFDSGEVERYAKERQRPGLA